MKRLMILILFLVTGCIGTDLVEDEIVNLTIAVENATLVNNAVSALPGKGFAFTASATNDRGTTYKPATVAWTSSDTNVAAIDESGMLQTKASGTTLISAIADTVQSNIIMISVAANNSDVALIEVTGSASVIDVDETIQLSARALNAEGGEVPNTTINWQSENDDIASVTADGEVTGNSTGMTNINASSSGVTGMYSITVGDASERMGQFRGLSGYDASGSVTLETDSDGVLSIQMGNDFSTSNGPGLYLYLSNSSNGVSGGVEVGKLRSTSGAETYRVPEGVTLDQFNHVLIYCKPFGVPFGTAELSSGSS